MKNFRFQNNVSRIVALEGLYDEKLVYKNMNINKIDIKEIRKITKTTISKKEKEEIEAKQKLEEAKKKKEREEREYAKDLTKYIFSIKEAAKKGRNSVDVDIGAISNNYTKYQIENIKSELKEFSPEFENCDDYYYDRNYDGDVIDSTRYTKVTVKFKW